MSSLKQDLHYDPILEKGWQSIKQCFGQISIFYIRYLWFAFLKSQNRHKHNSIETMICKLKKKFLIFYKTLIFSCSVWGLSSLTRDRTRATCIGSVES